MALASFATGLIFPPYRAWSLFVEAKGFSGSLRQQRAPTSDDLQKIGCIVKAAVAALTAPVLLINFKAEKLPIGALIWGVLYSADYFSNHLKIAAINICRYVSGLININHSAPVGFEKRSAVNDGNCFYHSILQQVQLGELQDNEASRFKLREMIADALVQIGNDPTYANKPAFDDYIALICKLEDVSQVRLEHYKNVAADIKNTMRWADHLEIEVLTQKVELFRNVKLVIYQARSAPWTWSQFFNDPRVRLHAGLADPRTVPDQGADDRSITVYLLNLYERHYEPLFMIRN